MGRHNRRRKNNIEDQTHDMNMSQSTDMKGTTKDKIDMVLGTVNNNKLLIGSIAGACGAAIFLLTTESGKRFTSEVQQRASSLYGSVSEQVGSGVGRLREMAQNMCSDGKRTSADIRRVS